MKKILLLVIFFALIFINKENVHAQTFMKYQTWASGHFMDPGQYYHVRLPFVYDSIKHVVVGDFNGDSIVEIAMLLREKIQGYFRIYTVESRGFRILDPWNNYCSATFVNNQEGLSLDSKGTVLGGDTARYDAGTEHSTNLRFSDNSSTFTNPSNIKFATAGNYIGDSKDEIAVFYSNDDNNKSEIYLFRNCNTNTALSYTFPHDSLIRFYSQKQVQLDFNTVKFILSGDFNGDGYDDIVMFQRSTNPDFNRIYLITNFNQPWTVFPVKVFMDDSLNLQKVVKATVGDFDGDGKDDVALLYDDNNQEKILVFYNNNFQRYVVKYNEYADNLDFNKVQHAVAGDFDGDTTVSGKRIDKVALFYDNGTNNDTTGLGAVQEVFVSKDSSIGWQFNSVIKEHRKNINFKYDTTRFAIAGNFDYDICKRDDIGLFYFGTDNDHQNEYDKILMWISLPSFNKNNFIIETNHKNESGNYEYGKFFPLGAFDVRLSTGFSNCDSLIPYYPSGYSEPWYNRGKLSEEHLRKYSKVFNTVVTDRLIFTDSKDNYQDTLCPNYLPSNSPYDYFTGYVNGLRAYLNKADSLGLKVYPFVHCSSQFNYDINQAYPCTNGISQYYKIYNNFSNPDSIPKYFKDIYDPVNNFDIHNALLSWIIDDEPTNIFHPGIIDIFNYKPHFDRYPNFNINIDSATQLLTNYKNYVKQRTIHPISLNFNGIFDFDFYNKWYDIAQFDSYPFYNWSDHKDSTIKKGEDYYKIIDFSNRCFNSVVRYNKIAGIYWGESVRYKDSTAIDTYYDSAKYYSANYNPYYERQRFNVFAPIIEGLRGYLFFTYNEVERQDTVSNSMYLIADEVRNYLPIFLTETKNTLVSTNYDRFIASDYDYCGPFTHSKFVNYSFHYDSVDNIYYLFVSSAHDSLYYNGIQQMPINVKFTIFPDQGVSNIVFRLGQDYFKNGLYDQINSTFNVDGNYLNFNDNFVLKDVKIYTIGGLPTLRKKTIADSIGFKGYLDYSNQRKLISYPYRQSSIRDIGSTDTVRYHAVYHKPNSQLGGNSAVYYRRSKPMSRWFPQELIEWDSTEIKLSDTVNIQHFFPEALPLANCECRNPSIVVRYSTSENKPKAYVVYTCRGIVLVWYKYPPPYYNFIVESILPANDSIQQYIPATAIDTIKGNDLTIWGTPVINASYNGNYYAWSDSIRKIVSGWKLPYQLFFDSLNMKNIFWNNNINDEALHPSLNSYSKILYNENDCALVWQENESMLGTTQVHYTRLREAIDSTPPRLVNYVTKLIGIYPFYIYYNADSTIACLSMLDNTTFNSMPEIYRGIEFYDTLNPIVDYDRVYWEVHDGGGSLIRIHYSGFDIKDTMRNGIKYPNTWFPISIYRIKSPINNLAQVNVSQGSLGQGANNYTHRGDSIMVVNFISYPGYEPSNTDKIWQINHNYWSYFDSPNPFGNDYETYKYAKSIDGYGNYPNLSAVPHLVGRGQWLLNRRIFETGSSIPYEIASSLQYFYKKSENDELVYPMFGYIKKNNDKKNKDDKYLVSPVWIFKNNNQTVKPNIISHKYYGWTSILMDTICTEWFRIDDFDNLKFIGYKDGLKTMSIHIQRKDDNKMFDLSPQNERDSVYSKNKFTLINGGRGLYRILWLKNVNNSNYTEEIVIGGLPNIFEDNLSDNTGYFGKEVSNNSHETIIDLGYDNFIGAQNRKINLKVYPNPATNTLYVKAYLPVFIFSDNFYSSKKNIVIIKIYSSVGNEFFKQEVTSGEAISIPLNHYPQGAYFIRAEYQNEDYWLTNPVQSAFEPFIIER